MKMANWKGLLVAIALVSCIGCEVIMIDVNMNRDYKNEMSGGELTVSPEVTQEKTTSINPAITQAGEGKELIQNIINQALELYFGKKVENAEGP